MALTQDQRELQAYIEQQNAEGKRKVEKEGGWGIFVTSDPKHWEGYGVFCVEQYRHFQAAESYAELMHDVHCIRVNRDELDELSASEMEEKLDEEIRDLEKQRKAFEEADKAELEKRREANKYQPNNQFAGLRDMMSR